MANGMTKPLLSIAIPTHNRAPYLSLTLKELRAAWPTLEEGSLEIVVSDNCSEDDTPIIVRAAIAAGLPLRSVRNDRNIGSDANIAQAFNLANGHYVLILGDDDLLVPGVLQSLMRKLQKDEYGVVCLRPYGYSRDFMAEHPGGVGMDRIYDDAGDFLAAIGPYLTLISACVINKSLLSGFDAHDFCGGHLVQVHLIMNAVLRANTFLYCTGYSVACKRNNSGGYDFAKVFVEELGDIFDKYSTKGLPARTTHKFETRMLFGYHPYYLLRQRLNPTAGLYDAYVKYRGRFKKRLLFWIWVAPIMRLPRYLAIVWGCLAVLIGRLAIGDLRRGTAFTWNRLSDTLAQYAKRG